MDDNKNIALIKPIKELIGKKSEKNSNDKIGKQIFTEDIKKSYFQKPDNSKSRALRLLLNLLVIVFVVIYALILTCAIQTTKIGIPSFADKSYYEFEKVPSELNTNNKLAVFEVNKQYVTGDKVGIVYKNPKTNKNEVIIGKVVSVGNDTVKVTILGEIPDGIFDAESIKAGITLNKNMLCGVYVESIESSFIHTIATTPSLFLALCIIPFALFMVIALIAYFALYPKKVKLPFFDEMFNDNRTGALQASTATDITAIPVQTQTAEQDETLTPYVVDEGESAIPGTNIENFYTSTKAKDGDLYVKVAKYPDRVTELQESGATDMDIIRMNMVGNSEFNALIATTHRDKPLSLEQIVNYMTSFDNVYCIKKRGAINWTYKYKSKTIMIIRGSNAEFKVSFKTYPDAAEKLNNVYKALEDSSFPSGPYWYMFNDLKNLSAPVAKWLIKESYCISMFQETKAELLREDKTLADLGIDSTEIKAQIDSGVNIITYDKFAIVAHRIDKKKLGLTTILDDDIPGINTSDYVKEVFYIVNGRDDMAISLLFAKNASEQLINALCMEIENFCTSAVTKQSVVAQPIGVRKDTAPVKMMKKNTKRR